jgi:hypothetical protein
MKTWEKNFESMEYIFANHTKAYLKAYRKEYIRNSRVIKSVLVPLAILTIFVPPLSLLFTIPAIVRIRKEIPPKMIVGSILGAFVPFCSGIMSMAAIGFFSEEQIKHKIKKSVFTKEAFQNNKLKFKKVKEKMHELDPDSNFGNFKPALGKKKKVTILFSEDGKNKVAVYMDAAQQARWKKLGKCAEILERLDKKEITEEAAKKKLSRAYQFFKENHKKSAPLVEKIEAQYNKFNLK